MVGKSKRELRTLSWDNANVESYDLVRHFVEINNKFPNNMVFVGNDAHGYISYDKVYDSIIEAGGEVVFKSSLHKTGVRKIYFLLDKIFILLEAVHFKSSNSFIDLPNDSNGFIKVAGQLTVLHTGDEIPLNVLEIIERAKLKMVLHPTVGIISKDNNGFFLNEVILEAEICNDLDLHYGDGFTEFHEKLMKRLLEKNKGISLFHGIHGSGKSYYINKLIYELKEKSNKKIILVPTNMIGYLLEPDFNTFLLDLVNESSYDDEESEDDNLEKDDSIVNGMIFILEDAEAVLIKREDSSSPQSTSNILNLTDGLLNSIFKIQIIATYNTADENIDPAIKRDKRLIAKRKFNALTLEESKRLAKSINLDETEITKGMTLAQIYSLGDKEDDDILIEDKRKPVSKGKAGIQLD